jgi:hypothetical protein
METNTRIESLERKRKRTIESLDKAKKRSSEVWARVGWGAGMRLSKIPTSFRREDELQERLTAIENEIYLLKKS